MNSTSNQQNQQNPATRQAHLERVSPPESLIASAMSTESIQHTAYLLSHRHPGVEIAFCIDQSLEDHPVGYFASSERHGLRPFSAVTNLIQGVYDLNPKFARKILRNRIFTTASHNQKDAGMIKVAAKCVTWNLFPKENFAAAVPNILWNEFTESTPPKNLSGSPLRFERNETLKSHFEYFRLAKRLARIIKREGAELYELDRPVAAILVSDAGEILCAAVNSNSKNRTRHAELNLIQRYYLDTGSLIPPGSRIYTTLKPCKMCAGIIHDCSADILQVQVHYLEDDPGTMAKQTCLEGKNLLFGPYFERFQINTEIFGDQSHALIKDLDSVN